jgi:hypothetical protein
MTDRVKGVTVSLDEDVRTDEIEPLLNAIRQIRGVSDVAVVTSRMDDWLARSRVRSELAKDFAELYKKITDRNS